MLVAIVASGLFAGASTYVSLVEHPARIESGGTAGIKQFGPSARRAAVMMGSLSMVGLIAGAVAWFQGSGIAWLVGGLMMGILAPYTFIVIIPINKRMLDPQFDTSGPEAVRLLKLWGQLHALRTALGVAAFLTFVVISWW